MQRVKCIRIGSASASQQSKCRICVVAIPPHKNDFKQNLKFYYAIEIQHLKATVLPTYFFNYNTVLSAVRGDSGIIGTLENSESTYKKFDMALFRCGLRFRTFSAALRNNVACMSSIPQPIKNPEIKYNKVGQSKSPRDSCRIEIGPAVEQ